jgi:hypothetical protein
MQPTHPTQPVTISYPSPYPSGSFVPGPGGPRPGGQLSGMPADPETEAFLRAVRRRQLIWAVVGGVLGLAAVIALLIWPEQVKEGVVQGGQALWRLLQMIFGGIGG